MLQQLNIERYNPMLIGNTPVLREPIDLRDAAQLKSLLAFIKNNEGHFSFTYQEAVNGLHTFVHMVPVPGPLTMLTIDSVNIRIDESRALSLWLSWIVELGGKIFDMADCEQIHALLGGYRNPTQIEASIFETNIAHYCFSLPGTTQLRFNQRFVTKRGPKYPEFVFNSAIGDIVCECKRLQHDQHESFKRFAAISGRVFHELGKINIPDGVRVDVFLEKPVGDTDGAIEQLRRAILDAIINEDRPRVTIGSFQFRLSSRTKPPPFEDYDFCQSNLQIQTNPTIISTKNALNPDSAIWMCAIDRKLRKAAGALMNEAMRQLPEDKVGVIFLGAPSIASIIQAANTRLSEAAYRHVLCFVLMDPKTFIYRTDDTEELQAIFGSDVIRP